MEIIIPAGFASQYLITDPNKYLSVLTPRRGRGVDFLFFNDVFTIDAFAHYLSRDRPKISSLFSVFSKNKARSRLADSIYSLNEILNDKPPTFMIDFATPIVIIASSFDPSVLRVIKIVKLRGYCLIGALSVGSILPKVAKEFGALVSSDPDYLLEQPFCQGFTNCKSAMLTSGLHSSVISTVLNVNSVLKIQPDLSQKFDLTRISEEI